jgi:UDP-glucose 4-epimerase
MRVLVTGCAGFIGSVTSKMLIEKGYEVTGIDDLSTGHFEAIDKDVNFVELNILDTDEVAKASKNCDAVIHFAGRSLVGESVNKPDLYWLNNLEGSKSLIQAVKINKISKFVFSSSAATYGNPLMKVIPETTKPSPMNPYGETKIADEEFLNASTREFNFGAISLRYFNVAGAYRIDNKIIGERHNPETHLIPNVLKATKDKPVIVFGDDWGTPDGTCIRDYVHVVDLAEAHISSLEKIEAQENKSINLGSGVGSSVLEILNTAKKVCGREIPYEIGPRRDGDPETLVAEIDKAKEILGWKPKLNLENMVNDAYEFIKS